MIMIGFGLIALNHNVDQITFFFLGFADNFSLTAFRPSSRSLAVTVRAADAFIKDDDDLVDVGDGGMSFVAADVETGDDGGFGCADFSV